MVPCPLWEKASPRAHLHPCPKGPRDSSPVAAANQEVGVPASWGPWERMRDSGISRQRLVLWASPGLRGHRTHWAGLCPSKSTSTLNSENALMWK